MDHLPDLRLVSVVASPYSGRTTLLRSLRRDPEPTAATSLQSLGADRKSGDADGHSLAGFSALSLRASVLGDQAPEDTPRAGPSSPPFCVRFLDDHQSGPDFCMADGALVVVDPVYGLDLRAQELLRLALQNQLKPALFVNKVDALVEAKASREDVYQALARLVESVNDVTAGHPKTALGDIKLYPQRGTVAFGSGRFGWAFTTSQFASRYSKKFGIDRDKLTERFWGDHYFDPATKTWTQDHTLTYQGKPVERAFNVFVLEPIFRIYSAVMGNPDPDDLARILQKLGLKLPEGDKDKKGEDMLKSVMKAFLPIRECLEGIAVWHLPSPETAQKYRVEHLYQGPLDDELAVGIRNCDPEAPLMIYVSRLVRDPSTKEPRLYAIGRVFSGTVRPGLDVRILGKDYGSRNQKDMLNGTIQDVIRAEGELNEPTKSAVPGSLVGLAGLEHLISTGGVTVTNRNVNRLFGFKAPKLVEMPLVQRVVDVKRPRDLPVLVERLKSLAKTDPSILSSVTDCGEHVIASANDENLTRSLGELREGWPSDEPLQVSEPFVQYHETATTKSSMTAQSRSPNKHIRLFMTAEPLGHELSNAIEAGIITPFEDSKARARALAARYGWQDADARRIWTFGPDLTGANLLVNNTKDVQYLNEIKDSMVSGFQWATREGPLAEEPVRGVRFSIMDVTLVCEAIFRGGGQVIPASRRVVYASLLLAGPEIVEPVYTVEVLVPKHALENVCYVLEERGAEVVSVSELPDKYKVRAELAVVDSFDVRQDMRRATNGNAYPVFAFSHWRNIPEGGSPLDPASKMRRIIDSIRRRKGMKLEVGGYESYET